MREENANVLASFLMVAGCVVLLLALIAAGFWGCPHYTVWSSGMGGKAELMRAEQNRKIRVAEAQAKLESAKLDAQSEIERAKGVAEANKIIGEGLKGHEEYLRYLWVMSLEHVASSPNGSTVVYIPTEGGLPVLEAGRLEK